ncbi:phage tail tape measure protein [Alkalilacustris brevis]|uniref:phage tail tape measure protein n=1 Tax=Alkalilacustris brevis TaxID=2026338 RepID=UPI000E0D03D0|nr:phage tail tape measure protein [Alkalilacustris brevis]
MADLEDLGERIAALETSLAGAQGMAAAFDGELQRMGRSLVLTGREVGTLSQSLGGSLRRAFDGVAFDGMRLSDALRQVARAMSESFYAVAMRPVQNAVGGALAQGVQGAVSALVPFGQGGGFAQGRVMPFAQGGVVSGPVAFPMRGGRTGLMGEAGPEAIMPLARGPDGRLGVRADGGGAARPVSVVINVSTPGVEGFRRSEAQIAAQMGRLLARGQRNR